MEAKAAAGFISQRLASLGTAFLVLILFASCGDRNGSAAASTDLRSTDSRVETMINNYEKLSNQYIHLSKKLKNGDVSVTVRYIELGKQARQESAELKQASNIMTPQQAQRVASISARTAPFMSE
ncbi:MAG TPA: hypothetical protein VGI60_17860 [Chthoniobacterales bacterium]|jgi:hypothetical protein